jgi:hypothetical protein
MVWDTFRYYSKEKVESILKIFYEKNIGDNCNNQFHITFNSNCDYSFFNSKIDFRFRHDP